MMSQEQSLGAGDGDDPQKLGGGCSLGGPRCNDLFPSMLSIITSGFSFINNQAHKKPTWKTMERVSTKHLLQVRLWLWEGGEALFNYRDHKRERDFVFPAGGRRNHASNNDDGGRKVFYFTYIHVHFACGDWYDIVRFNST